MKKEVIVCDFSGCRSLADNVCVLCDRDVCSHHGACTVTVSLTVEREGGAEGTTMATTLRRQYNASCCNTCAADATSAPASAGLSADTLLQPFNVQAIEYLRACFAAAKIKKGS